MRTIVIGLGPFGAQVLERLVQKGQEVAAVFSTVGRQGDPVQEMANKLGVTIHRNANMKDAEVCEKFSRLKPDLCVMAFVTDIVADRILAFPRLGTIQYHPSLLPKHRGGSAINWAIIKGETRTGLTIFWPDKGIDTGPILLQKEVDISPEDTLGSLYFNKLFPMGVESLLEAVEMVERGTAPRLAQDESRATYEGLCGEKEARIDWSLPANKTYNLIRGTNPQPGAYSYLNGKRLKIFDCQLIDGNSGSRPGQVLNISQAGIRIQAGDGAILAKRVQPDAMAKMDADVYAASVGLKPGTLFE